MPTYYVEDHPDRPETPAEVPATEVVEAKVVEAPAKPAPKKSAAKVTTKS